MPVTEIAKFVSISDRLATSGQPTEHQFQEIADEGYELIINLALHNDPRYSVPEEPNILAALGIEYIHIPVRFSAPAPNDLEKFFSAMERSVNRKTLVHCALNKRVSVFLALHRIVNLGWARSEAEEAMNAVWPPDGVWSKFFNDILDARG